MKIKFIKEYRALFGESLWNCAAHSVGAVLDVIPVQAQWLIDNGFAEEVKESGWWKPKLDEVYYCLDSTGTIMFETWYNDESDESRYSMGNCFKTNKAAEAWRSYRIAVTTVRQDEGVLTPEQVNELGRNSGVAYYVGCVGKHNGGKMLCECKMSLLPWTPVGMILFDTKEHAQASQDKHSDEWKIIANYDWSRE